MLITTISASLEIKQNLGPGSNVVASSAVWAKIRPDQQVNLDEINHALNHMVAESVDSQIYPIWHKDGDPDREFDLGLPEKFTAASEGEGSDEPPVLISTVSEGYTRKIDLGDYSSAQASHMMWAQLDESEQSRIEDIRIALRKISVETVKSQLLPIINRRKGGKVSSGGLKQYFLGLPAQLLPAELAESINNEDQNNGQEE